jgi:hypothetical protein
LPRWVAEREADATAHEAANVFVEAARYFDAIGIDDLAEELRQEEAEIRPQ